MCGSGPGARRGGACWRGWGEGSCRLDCAQGTPCPAVNQLSFTPQGSLQHSCMLVLLPNLYFPAQAPSGQGGICRR